MPISITIVQNYYKKADVLFIAKKHINNFLILQLMKLFNLEKSMQYALIMDRKIYLMLQILSAFLTLQFYEKASEIGLEFHYGIVSLCLTRVTIL